MICQDTVQIRVFAFDAIGVFEPCILEFVVRNLLVPGWIDALFYIRLIIGSIAWAVGSNNTSIGS
jgi:hypothetical protein